jgi:hypothetical protein
MNELEALMRLAESRLHLLVAGTVENLTTYNEASIKYDASPPDYALALEQRVLEVCQSLAALNRDPNGATGGEGE